MHSCIFLSFCLWWCFWHCWGNLKPYQKIGDKISKVSRNYCINLKYGFKICLCIQNLKYLNCSYCGSGTVQVPTFFSFSHFWGETALVRWLFLSYSFIFKGRNSSEISSRDWHNFGGATVKKTTLHEELE